MEDEDNGKQKEVAEAMKATHGKRVKSRLNEATTSKQAKQDESNVFA